MNYTFALIAFVVAGYADFWTTRLGFRNNFREGNPVIRWLLNKLPWDSEIELAGIKVALLVFFLLNHSPPWVLWTLAAVQLLAAAHNYRLLKRNNVL